MLLDKFSAVQSQPADERASIDASRSQGTVTVLCRDLDGCLVNIYGLRAVRQSCPGVGIFFIIRDSMEKLKNDLNESSHRLTAEWLETLDETTKAEEEKRFKTLTLAGHSGRVAEA